MLRILAKAVTWFLGLFRRQKAQKVQTQPTRRKADRRDKYGRRCVTFWNSSVRGTYRRPYRKVGRNDLCPCESGVKFKRCHGKETE